MSALFSHLELRSFGALIPSLTFKFNFLRNLKPAPLSKRTDEGKWKLIQTLFGLSQRFISFLCLESGKKMLLSLFAMTKH